MSPADLIRVESCQVDDRTATLEAAAGGLVAVVAAVPFSACSFKSSQQRRSGDAESAEGLRQDVVLPRALSHRILSE